MESPNDLVGSLLRVGMYLIPFLFALSVHEYAHGWMANKLGDNTARMMGRLSLNPLAHADMVGTFLLPMAAIFFGGPFFGWAKPVPINDRNIKYDKRGVALVAAAGPGSNIIMAIIGAAIYGITIRFFDTATLAQAIVNFSQLFIMINLSLAFFNLLPFHPLDGGKIVAMFLPYEINRKLEAAMPITSIILMLLFLSGGLGAVIFKPVLTMFQWLLHTSLTVFGVAA